MKTVFEQTIKQKMKGNMKMNTIGKLGLVAAGLLCSSGLALANSTDTLADLVANGGSLSVPGGDKIFSGFAYKADNLTSFDAADIQVTASESGGVYYLTWGGSIGVGTTSIALGDLLLNYTVTATGGKINEIDQNYTGGTSGGGQGQITVSETVTSPNSGGAIIGSTYLDSGHTSEPAVDLNSSEPYINPPQSELFVTKDIGLLAVAPLTGGSELVSVSQVQQSFHQTTVVPDGGMTLSLLGLAMAGCGMLRRKQSK